MREKPEIKDGSEWIEKAPSVGYALYSTIAARQVVVQTVFSDHRGQLVRFEVVRQAVYDTRNYGICKGRPVGFVGEKSVKSFLRTFAPIDDGEND